MSGAELARRIEVPVNCITEILNGRRSITGDTALRLGSIRHALPATVLRDTQVGNTDAVWILG